MKSIIEGWSFDWLKINYLDPLLTVIWLGLGILLLILGRLSAKRPKKR
jgi:hypothetical protein